MGQFVAKGSTPGEAHTMSKSSVIDANNHIELLRYLLVLELWQNGVSQAEIRARLGISNNTVNAMLKGISRKASKTIEE